MKQFLLLLLLLAFSCHNPIIHTDGGPCTYTTDTIPATVIAIQPHDSLHSEILFTVQKTPGKTDTLYYTKELGRPYATNEELENMGVEEGAQFIYLHESITDGTCTPEMFAL